LLTSSWLPDNEGAKLAAGLWQLKRGDELVGTLILDEVDMFWTDCRFESGPGWDEVSALFEALQVARQHGTEDEQAQSDHAIMARQMVLVPDDGGEPVTRMLLRISEGHARFRRLHA
jgi:hypothetical protein